MSTRLSKVLRDERGVGLMEVMISIVIGMLLVLVIYQVYEISEGQKRTITAGSDAMQNASYGLYVLGRDVSMAGNGIASTAMDGAGNAALDGCAALRPIPVLIEPGANDNDPDKITVLYGGSSSLSTAVPFRQSATGAAPYVVPGPVGFSAHATDVDKTDLVVAVQVGTATCTLSRVNAGGISVDPATGFTTIQHTPIAGDLGATYNSGTAVLVNLGQPASMGRIEYTVDTTDHVLRTQNLLPDPAAAPPPSPIINEVVNLKAQYGVDANCDGVLVWRDPTGPWSFANVQVMPLPVPPSAAGPFCVPGTPSLRQIQAVRIAIVTRSTQYEKDIVTPALPASMPAGRVGLFCDPAPTCAVSMTLNADDQHYRYKVLETSIPLRNALWNGQ